MKYYSTLLICFLISISFIVCEKESKERNDLLNNKSNIIGDKVRLRNGPYLQSKTKKIITPEDNPVTVLAVSLKTEKINNSENYWLQIRTSKDVKGWVYGKYVKAYVENNLNSAKLEIVLSDEEYKKYVKPFIKSLNGEFVNVYQNKYRGERINFKKNNDIILYPDKTDKGYLYGLSESYYATGINGKVDINNKPNRIPEITIILENGYKKEMNIEYDHSKDIIEIDGYLRKEDAEEYYNEFSKQ